VLADLLDNAQSELLLREAKETLPQFRTPEGSTSFNSSVNRGARIKKEGFLRLVPDYSKITAQVRSCSSQNLFLNQSFI
jgi:hypothetical protein